MIEFDIMHGSYNIKFAVVTHSVPYTLVHTSLSLSGWDRKINCRYCSINGGCRRSLPLTIALWPTRVTVAFAWCFRSTVQVLVDVGRGGSNGGLQSRVHDSQHTCFPNCGDTDTDITVIAHIDSLRHSGSKYSNFSIRCDVPFLCPPYHDNYDNTSNRILNILLSSIHVHSYECKRNWPLWYTY